MLKVKSGTLMTFKQLVISAAFMIGAVFLSACEQEQAKQTPPPKPAYDSAQALQRLADQVKTSQTETAPLPADSDYIQVQVHSQKPKSLQADFLKHIASPDSQVVVLLGHLKNGETLKLPTVPFAIYEKNDEGWQTVFLANGPITPLFVAQRAPLSVSLELVLLKDKLEGLDDDGNTLIGSYVTDQALLSKERTHDVSARADAFLQRMALVEERSFKDFDELSISYLESLGAQIDIAHVHQNQEQTLTLSVKGRQSELPLSTNRTLSYSDIMNYQIAQVTIREALDDLERLFWSTPKEGLRAGCQAISGALQERLGLSEKDSALILWHMVQPHTIFARGVDYALDCTGEDLSVQLSELGYALPVQKPQRAKSSDTQKQNRVLTSIATQLKSFTDKSYNRIEGFMDETVFVRDETRFLMAFDDKQLVQSPTDVVAPMLSKASTTEFISMLPVQSFGCYMRGQGQSGNQRATLVQLENDPSLWILNFAFNEKNKIKGIQFQSASQRDFCRAIGGRKGANRCVFSDKNFPGLQADRCG